MNGEPGTASLRRDFPRGLALVLSSPSLIVWFASAGGAVIAWICHLTQSPPYLFPAGFCCGLVWAVFMPLVAGDLAVAWPSPVLPPGSTTRNRR